MSKNIQKKARPSEKLSNFLLSWLLWTWGGTFYFFIEVVYKTIIGHESQISWTMLLVAFILCIPLERFGAELPWEMPMSLQCLISCVAITVTELIAGLIINVWLGMNVWDYSDLPFNFMGQICLQFSCIWLLLSFFGIKAFDWIRYTIVGGLRPKYKMFKKCSMIKVEPSLPTQ